MIAMLYLRKLSRCLLAVVLVCSVQAALAITVEPNDWYAHYTANRGDRIENGGTNSPTYYLANVSNARTIGTVWSYFDPVTLVDGGSIRMSTQMTVDFRSASSSIFQGIRVGLYKSGEDRATTETFGQGRYVSDLPTPDPTEGWDGFFVSTASSENYVYRRDEGTYTSTTGTTRSSEAMGDSLVNPTFGDNVAVELVLIYARSGDDLIVSGSFGGSDFSGSYLGAFTDGYSDTFDTFGFWASNTNPQAQLVSALFEDAQIVVVVPEPAVSGLFLAGAVAMILLFVRHRRKGI